ncbi:hypothetical protein ACLB2K_067683 [Fragaria x ananassa]
MSETRHLPSEPEPPNEPDPTQLTRWCTNHNFNPFADPIDSRSWDGDWFSDAADDSDRDVSCFVTDLFDRRDSDHPSGADCVLVSGSDPFVTELETERDDGDDLGSNSNLGLGFGAESNSQGSGSEFDDFLAPQGLRVVGLESDSDSENDEFESNRVSEGIQSIWDSIFMEEQRNAYENSEWEEVTEPPENPIDGGGGGGGVEELSAASGFTSEEEDIPEGAVQRIEWEILLTVNNFRRNVDDVELDIETAEYIEAIFGQFVENASACKGSPPAALRVVEDLPFVEFTVEELSKEEVFCAVCKDDIVLEDKVRSLPCCHYYHQDCIVPWLSIRNTCPVCRYELPTDDLDYERSKCERAAHGLSWESQVRVDFERFV